MNTQKRENLIDFRKKNKKTQEEMADLLKISIIMYKSLELGYKNPSFKTLENFKNSFPNASLDKIFF